MIALRRLQSRIEPFAITRTKAEFNQANITDNRIASATAIRRILMTDRSLTGIRPFVPAATLEIMTREWKAGRGPVDWERFAKPLLLQLMHHSPEQLTSFHEVTEGLEHRIRKALADLRPDTDGDAAQALVETLIDKLKTKRYTRTKLQRTLLRILLNHSKQDLSPETLRQGVPYLRVLGFSPKGQELLKRMKKNGEGAYRHQSDHSSLAAPGAGYPRNIRLCLGLCVADTGRLVQGLLRSAHSYPV